MIITLLYLLVFAAVLGIVFWLIGQLPLAAPFDGMVKIIAVVIALVLLFSFVGGYVPQLHLR